MLRDALVVGVNSYRHLPSLQAPARDAEAIAHQLHAQGDFRVHRLPEVILEEQPQIGQKTPISLKELESALVRLFKPKGSTVPHTALFYFSGHGIQKDAGIQEGYLAVSDSNPEAGFYGLSLFWLRRLLQESPVRQRIIWLDCCHSGELLNFLEADPGARAGTDRLFMAASREYEPAYESLDSPYSVFTKAILEGLDPRRTPDGIITNYSLTDWVSHALKAEIQHPLFENSGSEIILTRQGACPKPPQAIPTQAICPYRGLEFFDEAHSEYFFGREDLTDYLIDKLRTGRFVAVVGASGSGKSSLVRAGVVQQLRQGQKFSGSDRWRIKLITPTEHPLKSLAAAFLDPNGNDLERAEQLYRAESFLQHGGSGLAQLVRASLPMTTGTTGLTPTQQPCLLLIIDQFEEVFTLCRGTYADRERQHFFNSLIQAQDLLGDYLRIVVVLRADFFSKCSLYENLAQQLEQNLVLVTPLNYDQIRATIVRPAEKVGLVCDPNLIYTILMDVIGAPGELPLLQYTLLELWKRRTQEPGTEVARLTLDTYTELGGVKGTLQKRATQIYHELPPQEQQVAKRIFLALTQLGEGTEDTRRRILKSELVSSAFSLDVVECALEKLVAAKLVVTNQVNDDLKASSLLLASDNSHGLQSTRPQETIDVAHEALIRNWPLLRSWLDESREMLARQRRIERAAQEWNSAGQPLGEEYLLRGGRLVDAEDFVTAYPHELSELAQVYIQISQDDNQRTRRESRLLQIAVPSVLLVALMITVNQYRSTEITQAEKDYQLKIATSRERAAIAQAILQEPSNDPTAALLISRLAAEGGFTYEAQSSLRAALQSLRLQLTLQGHQGPIYQIHFDPRQNYLASAGADGTIRLWAANQRVIYTGQLAPWKTLTWTAAMAGSSAEALSPGGVLITKMTINSTGERIAAIAKDTAQVKVWDVATGEQVFTLELSQPATDVAFSPDGQWIATADGSASVALWQAATGQLETRLTAPEPTKTLAFNPVGAQLMTQGATTVHLWQLLPNVDGTIGQKLLIQPVAALQHLTPLVSATFSPTGKRVLTTAADGVVRLWDAATGNGERSLLPLGGATTEPANRQMVRSLLSPDESLVATVDAQRQVWIWDTSSGQVKAKFPVEPRSSSSSSDAPTILFSPDSQRLITLSAVSSTRTTQTATLWDIQTSQPIDTFGGPAHSILTAQFNADGTQLATASDDGTLFLWATEDGGELPTVALPGTPIRWIAFTQPGVDSSSVRSPGMAHTVSTLAATPSDSPLSQIVAVGANGQMRQWAIDVPLPSQPESRPESHSAWSSSHLLVAEKPDIQNFWHWFSEWTPKSSSRNSRNAAMVPSVSQSRLNNQPQPPQATGTPTYPDAIATPSPIVSTAISQNGQLIALATASGAVDIQQAQADGTLATLHQLMPPPAPATAAPQITQLAFSTDQNWLIGVGTDQQIRLWNVQTGQIAQTLRGDMGQIFSAQLSQDGQLVVTASADRMVRIWNTASGQVESVIPHRATVSQASFSPDGLSVISVGQDGIARVFDTNTGQLQVLLTGHQGTPLDAQFSPDNRIIATTSTEGAIYLWNARTGVRLAHLRLPTKGDRVPKVQQLAFSPNGQYVAALTQDGKVHLWAATWETLLNLARGRTPRQLTSTECRDYLNMSTDLCPRLD